jgi:hypothetical protein
MSKKEILMLLIALLTFNIVVAQDVNIVSNLLPSLIGVIFILVFILILLMIGGVIKKPAAGIPGSLIVFTLLIIAFFIIPQFVPYPAYLEVPQNFKISPLPSYAASVFMMLGLPSEWMYVPAIIYLFILPFAAIYTLAWAFLQSLEIFTNVPSSINRVLAFIIAFLTIPIGWFVKIVWVLFSFMGAWSVVIFAITFIAGVFFRGYGTVVEAQTKAMARRWRIEAERHLRQALVYINANQAGSAMNELDAAKRIYGFSADFYSYITNAITELQKSPPDYKAAEGHVKDALKVIGV